MIEARLSKGMVLFLTAAVATPIRGQIVTENAGVASPELPSLREAFSVRQARNIDELRLESQFICSFSPKFETRTTVPMAIRDVGATEIEGLGDVAIRCKHSWWQVDDVLESTRFAGLYECSLPAGDEDARDDTGAILPPQIQLGSGTLGVGGGAAFTVIRDRHRFSNEVFYRHTLDHDGFDAGDKVQANLAYWYRFLPATFRAGPERDALELRGVLEVLTTYRFESHAAAGLGDQGTEVWLAPGLQFFGNGCVLFEASFQVPVYQDVEDVFGRREWAATIAIKFLF